MLPMPGEEYTISFGRAQASAMSSLTFFTGSDGCETSSSGKLTMLAIYVKSFSVS